MRVKGQWNNLAVTSTYASHRMKRMEIERKSKSKLVGSVRELMKREWTVCRRLDYAQPPRWKKRRLSGVVELKLVGVFEKLHEKGWTVYAVSFDYAQPPNEEKEIERRSKSEVGWSVRETSWKEWNSVAVAFDYAQPKIEWREWRFWAESNRSLLGDVRRTHGKEWNSVQGFDYASHRIESMEIEPAWPAESKSEVGWECSRNFMKGVNSVQWLPTIAQPPNEENGDWAESKSKVALECSRTHGKGVNVCSASTMLIHRMKSMEIEACLPAESKSKWLRRWFENHWKGVKQCAVASTTLSHAELKRMEIEAWTLPAEFENRSGWNILTSHFETISEKSHKWLDQICAHFSPDNYRDALKKGSCSKWGLFCPYGFSSSEMPVGLLYRELVIM